MGDIHKIEKAQRQATKILPEFLDYSYYKRLTELNLPSLLYHRRRMNMIMHKIIHGVDGCPFNKSFTLLIIRSNGYKLLKQFNHLNVMKYSFSQVINDSE